MTDREEPPSPPEEPDDEPAPPPPPASPLAKTGDSLAVALLAFAAAGACALAVPAAAKMRRR